MSRATEALRDLVTLLEQQGHRWYLFGAQAASFWGQPRTTADIDVTVQVAPAEVETLVQVFEAAGFQSRDQNRTISDDEAAQRGTDVIRELEGKRLSPEPIHDKS